jgi:hypothetical protein
MYICACNSIQAAGGRNDEGYAIQPSLCTSLRNTILQIRHQQETDYLNMTQHEILPNPTDVSLNIKELMTKQIVVSYYSDM